MTDQNRPDSRVVVTGIGVLSGLGSGLERFANSLFAAKTAIGRIQSIDTENFSCQFGAELTDFDGYNLVRKSELHQFDRVSLMAMAAADEALAQAELDKSAIGPVTGVMMGTGFGPAQAIQESLLRAESGQRLRPTTIVKMMLNSPTAALCARYGLQKSSTAHVTACAASAHAIAQAAQAIRSGEMELCLAGGADAFPSSVLFAAWDALGVMSDETDLTRHIVRPFAIDRRGFAIGEAASVLVLEREDRAIRRGAPVLAEVVGAGIVSDTPSLTKPTLAGMTRAMQSAMHEAGLHPSEIGHINAHGTATELNDRLETAAIEEVFGDYSRDLKISACKAAYGHCMGASGALGAAASVVALQRRQAPPTLGLQQPDPKLTLDYCGDGASPMETEFALSNSFAFGGHYVTLAFKRRLDL